ncbi:MAG: GNAT family N-acetyltransferase [Chthonomonadetes bacterium]|nr:GNAT family N-acetyltransferase [Chthonomonadetes bacterium]
MAHEEIIITQEQGGAKRVILQVDGEDASWCWIVPFTIRIGAATVRMDGIGGVETKPEHRLKGYASRVLRRAVEEMTAGDAGITMLYGIRDFYHRFGYVTAGPEYALFLPSLSGETSYPAGWSVREFTSQDLPAVQAVYERATALATGVAVRAKDGGIWQKMLEAPGSYPQDELWVAVSPDGEIEGYVWRARWCWSIRYILESEFPNALAWGEVIALSPPAADALLTFCRRRAKEEGKEETLLPIPPDSVLAHAARYADCRAVQMYSENGGSMVRVLDTWRLLKSLEPELSRQMRATASNVPARRLTIRTECGQASLHVSSSGVEVLPEGAAPQEVVVIPQGTLARLALGFAPVGDLCARLPEPPTDGVTALLEALFPSRYQHMYLPDRY